jgi:hypothetical protein
MAACVPTDLHRHRSVVMKMSATGEVLNWIRLANHPDTLVSEVLKCGKSPAVAIQATYGWYRVAGAFPSRSQPPRLRSFGLSTSMLGRTRRNLFGPP